MLYLGESRKNPGREGEARQGLSLDEGQGCGSGAPGQARQSNSGDATGAGPVVSLDT